MRYIIALAVSLALTGFATPLRAQVPSLAKQRPAPTSQHPPTFLDRVYIDADGAYQSHTFSFSDTRQEAWLQETASWTADYDVKSAPSLLVGGGVRVWQQLIVRGAYSAFRDTNASAITGTVPHPFFFDHDRAIAGSESALKQREDVIDVGVMWVVPINRRLDTRAFGGPSYFRVKRDLLQDVKYRDAYPYDTAEFAGVTRSEVEDTAIGFHVGADVTYRIAGPIGVGGTVRFSRATVKLTSPANAATLSIDAGGLQVGGGLRLRLGGAVRKASVDRSKHRGVPPKPLDTEHLGQESAPGVAPPSHGVNPPESPVKGRGARASIRNQCGVFILPDPKRTPLAVLPIGTTLRVLEEQGEWLVVEFNDSRFGPRQGFVLKANTDW